jgi:hypothetical protein
VNGYSYNAKWEEQQPHKRIEDEREQRQGPAENEENAPEQKGEHGRNPP